MDDRREEEALDKLRSAHETMLAAHGRHHPDTLSMWVDLVDALSTADLDKEAIGKTQAMGQALLASETVGEYRVTFYSTLDEAHPDAGHDVQADQWRSQLASKIEADSGNTTSADDGE